jgi:hypothetical protein
MKVIPITRQDSIQFILEKHYSHRMPIFWAGFGLIENNLLQGVCIFGQPSPPLQKYAFPDRDFRFYELSRLVIQTSTKNAASFLVGNALKMLPKPCAVVSFADTEFHHCGFIYQATNWIYTGSTLSHDKMYIIDGKRVHSLSLGIKSPAKWAKENGIETVAPLPKHRYFYFCGDKRDRRRMGNCLRYPIVSEYPKLNPVRYDDGKFIVKEV